MKTLQEKYGNIKTLRSIFFDLGRTFYANKSYADAVSNLQKALAETDEFPDDAGSDDKAKP